MTFQLIVQFLILTTVISGVIIFTLHRVFVSSVEGAKQRLERDAEAARAREAELNRKIKEADEELSRRRKELNAMEQKMKTELEAEANKHKEELINKARSDAEEIIVKAQNAAEGFRRDIEKQMEIKIVDYSAKILETILIKKAREALEKELVEEFIAQLKDLDMSKISPEIKSADVVTAYGMAEADLKKIFDIFRTKTGRDIAFQGKTDGAHISGAVIQFGSLRLDGSLKAAIRESSITLKTEIEKAYLKK